MGSIELTVMRLLKTMEACRRTLDERVNSLQLIDAVAGAVQGYTRLSVAQGSVKHLMVRAEVLVAPATSEGGVDWDRLGRIGHNSLHLSTGVEVVEAGFHVVAAINASLGWTMGASSVGWHDFYQYRSAALTFDEATAEVQHQTAIMIGLDTYGSALGFVAA